LEVVIAGRTVFLPDTASTRHGAVCILALRFPERGAKDEWVRLVYRGRGVEPRLGEDDPGYRGIPVDVVDEIMADDLASEAQRETREQARLWRALTAGGDALATAYGGGVLWR